MASELLKSVLRKCHLEKSYQSHAHRLNIVKTKGVTKEFLERELSLFKEKLGIYSRRAFQYLLVDNKYYIAGCNRHLDIIHANFKRAFDHWIDEDERRQALLAVIEESRRAAAEAQRK